MIGFLVLNNFYNDGDESETNTYANTLKLAFTSTLNYGLRYGGGIGEAIENPAHGADEYWAWWIFSIIFFIIVNVLIINIIFGT